QVRVYGNDNVAVREIVRAARKAPGVQQKPPTTPSNSSALARALDENKLTQLSRAILSSKGSLRGKAYLDRAIELAEAGEGRAALEDARAAKALRVLAPDLRDPVSFTHSKVRPKPPKPVVLPAGINTYGLDADFDDNAPRCLRSAPTGPR